MANPERHAGSESEDLSDDDMGIDPMFTPDEIARIQVDAQAQDPEALAPALEQGANNKRKTREVMTAEAWQYYTKGEVEEDGSYTATCIYCGKVYKMGNSKGTGSLKHHWTKGCKKMPQANRYKKDALQMLLQAGSKGEKKLVPWVFDQAKCRKSFAKMVIVHEYPFNCVTHHYLKVFLNDLQPEFKLVTRNTLRADCIKMYEEGQMLLYEELDKLDCRVSFTSDLWTSNSRDKGFLCITCHYISDDWKLKKRIITFISLPSPHTGKNIAQALFDKLILWNLDKKSFCLVLDNASSNEACIGELLNTPLRDALPVAGSIFHQRCGCHNLNLIVQDGLHVLASQIEKVRETMKYIRHSQARMEKFRLAATQAKAPTDKKPAWDVPTRWNSTFIMLQLALELHEAINRFSILDKNFTLAPSASDWTNVEALVECLKVYYDATMKLSGTLYPTLNLFFPEFCEVFMTIKKMKSSSLPFIVDMGKEMYAKWDKYWTSGNMLLAIACVLDPRCKLTVVEYYFKMLYPRGDHEGFVATVKDCMQALFTEYLEAHSKLKNKQSTSSSRQPLAIANVSDIRAGLKEVLWGKKSTEIVVSELEDYLTSALDDASLDEAFDILSWWQLKGPKYPILSRLTRDILAVLISTVASEATFSTSGRTLSAVRNSLNDESIEALIRAQDWLRASIIENGGEVGDPLWTLDEAKK